MANLKIGSIANSFFWVMLSLFSLGEARGEINRVKFELIWEQPETKLELKTFQAPPSMVARVGETGEYNEKKDLPITRNLPDQSIELVPGESAVLYLVAKNPGKKAVKFYVAPHHIHPAEASLGFKFNCLCYNHVYTVEPGKLWYRVMHLKTEAQPLAATVRLKHTFVRKQ